VPKDRHGRILVDDFLKVKDTPDVYHFKTLPFCYLFLSLSLPPILKYSHIFVLMALSYAIGDCSAIESKALPATAQVFFSFILFYS
jgi:hypothetical protein